VTIVNQLNQAETLVTNDAEAPISTRRVVSETTHALTGGGSVAIAGRTPSPSRSQRPES